MFKSSPSQFMTVIYSMEYNGKGHGVLNEGVNEGVNSVGQGAMATYFLIKKIW